LFDRWSAGKEETIFLILLFYLELTKISSLLFSAHKDIVVIFPFSLTVLGQA
jgi:hypothetical protein